MSILKKLTIVSTSLLFLTLCVFPAIDAEPSTRYDQSENPEMVSEEITIYRVDITGIVTPVKTFITYEDGQDPERAIAEKCKELCKNDKDMIQSIDTSGWGLFKFEINSSGNGTHWAFRRILFPHRRLIYRTTIQFRYFFEGNTTIINRDNGLKNSWEGPHSFRLNGFTGYVNFKPRRLLGSRLFGSTIIQGYAGAIAKNR